jgi:hypothetical protein
MSLGETKLSSSGGGCRNENRSAPTPVEADSKAIANPQTQVRPNHRTLCPDMRRLQSLEIHQTTQFA